MNEPLLVIGFLPFGTPGWDDLGNGTTIYAGGSFELGHIVQRKQTLEGFIVLARITHSQLIDLILENGSGVLFKAKG